MSNLSYTTNFQGVADAFMRDAKLYAPLLEFINNVMTRPSDLSIAEREIIAGYVSHLNGCGFCVGVHEATLTALGTEESIVGQLERGPESTAVDDRLRAILTFSRKLTRAPETVQKADIDALAESSWSEQAIEDAMNVVSLFSYMNRLIDGLGIEGNQGYFDVVGKSLASQGYAPLVEMARKKAA